MNGKDYLLYKSFHIDACILHASYADEDGNISLQDEPIRGELLELASAVHNNGGIVIVEVKDIVKPGSLDPRQVLIHKSYVDYLVKAENSGNVALAYNAALIGDIRVPTEGSVKALPMSYKKVIVRRAVMELEKDALVNLGIGIPAGVANVANEEGLSVLCTAGAFDLLITGDMAASTERELIAAYGLPDIEVLFVGHHGSKFSTSEELLEAVTPEAGVISVGTRNTFGHPAREAMERMAFAGMTLYRTDEQGDIIIQVHERGDGT